MRKCLGKHSCMSSPFPIAILNGTFFFRSVKAMNNWKRSAIKQILLLIIIVFWLGCDSPSGLLFFVPSLILSILTSLFLSSSSVSLSYFVLAVPMRECSGKHLCTSSPFPMAILNGNFFFREAKWSLLWPKLRLPKFNHTTTTTN